MRTTLVATVVALGAAASVAVAQDARACGGCFHGPTQNGDPITAHRMIFSVSPTQTTLYDEIEYTGDPQSFAWVLPISGPVTVGLSSDTLFAALDQATQTTIVSPNLPACPSCSCADFGASGSSGGSGGGTLTAGGVNVLSQQVVGPYDTVQLQSTDPNALTSWLTVNGYSIPDAMAPIIAAYVQDGFDFLALKLQPGAGVQAMRPVRVSSPGAGMTLPLRMVAAGTGPQVGITLWVVGQGRYEPTNFPSFTIDPSKLVWDWTANASNYATLQQQAEATASYAAWQIESAQQYYVQTIENNVLDNDASQDYPTGTATADAGVTPTFDSGVSPTVDAGAPQTPEEARAADLAAAFSEGNAQLTGGQMWITRLRADLAQQALGTDLTLGASATQTPLPSTYQVTQSVNAPACPSVPNPCPPCGNSAGSGSGGPSNGTTTKPASSGQQSFGCSAAPADHDNVGLDLVLGGMFGASLLRSRLRRGAKKSK